MKDVYWVAGIGLLIFFGGMKIFDQGNQIKDLSGNPTVTITDNCEKNRCKDKEKIILNFDAPSSKVLKDYFRSLQHHD